MRRLLAAVAIVAVLPVAANAQSLYGTKGLGVPQPGVDARARALGVNGVGLAGLSTTLLNPAEAGGIFRRGVSASFQPWGASVEFNGEEGDISGTRFPLMEVFYPFRRFTVTLGYSGIYDQSWAIIAESAQNIGGTTVNVSDVVRSSGGIGEVRVGAAYYMSERLSLGVSAGLHTGFVQRSVSRTFPDSTIDLLAFETNSRWRYSGPAATVGVRWDASNVIRVGASVGWSGTLKAEPDTGNATSYEYDMPLRLAGGFSAQLSPTLMFAASALMSAYGEGSYSAPASGSATIADRTVEAGAGLEWSEIRTRDRVFPLRVGGRVTKLPFRSESETAAKEWAVSGGIGFRLVQDDVGPLAVADVGFERGQRTGWESAASPNGLSEKFWRVTVSMSLFGR